RARNAEPQRTGLAGNASTCGGGHDIKLFSGLGGHQRATNHQTKGFGGEGDVDRFAVDGDGAVAGPEEHAGGRGLAAARAIKLSACCCHVTLPRAFWAVEPHAGVRYPRTPSTSDTSPRQASSSATCRGPL